MHDHICCIEMLGVYFISITRLLPAILNRVLIWGEVPLSDKWNTAYIPKTKSCPGNFGIFKILILSYNISKLAINDAKSYA